MMKKISLCWKLHLLLWLAATVPVVVVSQCTSDTDCAAEESFCGRDGSCTQFSCENWFQNGPEAFTGYDPNNAVSLTCADYGNGMTDNMNSVVFGCRPYSPGKKAPEAKTWTYFFNQECKATPANGKEFKCYQNKANTDYGEYIGEAARKDIPPCDRNTYDTEQPFFWYIKEASQLAKDGSVLQTYGKGRDNTASSDSFDASEADKTMYAVLMTDSSGSGSGSSGSGSGGGGGDGGSSSSRRSHYLWTLGAAFFGIGLVWFL